jgi:hypothetical protein
MQNANQTDSVFEITDSNVKLLETQYTSTTMIQHKVQFTSFSKT